MKPKKINLIKKMMKLLRFRKIKMFKKNGDFYKKFRIKYKILQEIKLLKTKTQIIYYKNLKSS